MPLEKLQYKSIHTAEHIAHTDAASTTKTVFDVQRTDIPELTASMVMEDPEHLVRLLGKDGELLEEKYSDLLSREDLLKAYRYMVLSRQQDTYMTQLQRQGRMYTFAGNFGEEALQVGVALALKPGDWFVPAFRSNATMLMLGVPLIKQLLYWNGQERGSQLENRGTSGVTVLPINIPIGTTYSHAAGIGYALRLQRRESVAVAFVGNGGTAEGEVYEAMNFASIWKWNVVFCVNNNQWAISTPNSHESGSSTISAKAKAVGIPAYRVDGNDLLASYEVSRRAFEWAREGNGPVLLEFVTWRQGPHTSSDNPKIYRTSEVEKIQESWEPMQRIEKFLKNKGYITDEKIKEIWELAMQEVKQTYEESLKVLYSTADEIFDHTYEELTPALVEQKSDLAAYQAWRRSKGLEEVK